MKVTFSLDNQIHKLYVSVPPKKFIFKIPSVFTQQDLIRLIERKWIKIFKKDESWLTKHRNVCYIARKILNGEKVELREDENKIANKEELKKLFDDISKRVKDGERGIDLALEMKARGFKPIVRDFSHHVFEYLIIHDVIFNECGDIRSTHCFMEPSRLLNDWDYGLTCDNLNFYSATELKYRLVEIQGYFDHDFFIFLLHKGLKSKRNLVGLEEVLDELKGNGSEHWIAFAQNWRFDASYLIPKYIHHFGITDQTQLTKIAKDYLMYNIAQHIQNFGITNKKALHKLAKECTRWDRFTIKYLKNFGIKKQRNIINLVKRCAKNYSDVTSAYIHEFGIHDQTTLIEIAKTCANGNGYITASNIKKFGIKDKDALKDIAMICAEDRWNSPIEFISDFEISDSKAKIEFAMKCARFDGMGTFKHILKLGIDCEEAIIKLVKECAINGGGVVAPNIQKFHIKDKNVLLEIALRCAKSASVTTAGNIRKFGFEDERCLKEIAKVCILHSDDAYTRNQFGISERGWVEVLKNVIKTDAEKIVPYIHHIPNHEDLIFLAKECAKIPGNHLAKHIPGFGICNEQTLIELAYECARTSPVITSENIDNFNISNKVDLYEIAKICSESIEINFRIFKISEPKQKVEMYLRFFSEVQCTNYSTEFEYARDQTQGWLDSTVAMFAKTLSKEQIRWIDDHKFLMHIQNLKNPKLRWRMTCCLYAYVIQNDLTPIELYPNETVSKKSQKKAQAVALINLIKCSLKQKGVPANLNEKQFYDDAIKLNAFLNAFSKLCVDEKISSSKIIEIQNDIFENETIKKLKYVAIIYQLHQQVRLHSSTENIENTIKQILNEMLEDVLRLDAKQMERFNQVFLESRNANAIFIYAANLINKDKKIDEALRVLFDSISNDKFQSTRYDVNLNPHLRLMDESLLNKWKTNTTFHQVATQTATKLDMHEWLKTKLIIDKHLSNEAIPHLVSFLITRNPQVEALLDQLPQDNAVMIQKLCLSLLKANKIQEDILNQLLVLTKGTEFQNDIKALLQKQSINSTCVIVNTDDPIDILLCGTEVLVSCQRIDGDFEHNKGLLGYLLNGQTRLLAVKTEAGIIQARCLLRLLWDEKLKKPVLFRERIYGSSYFEFALNKVAAQIAKELEIKITLSGGKGRAYPNNLISVGGIAPYEYVDGAAGISDESQYRITSAKYLSHD